jgi:hypothetical protein
VVVEIGHDSARATATLDRLDLSAVEAGHLLGVHTAVNKAMRVELDATAIHLHKAAWSNEAYYRSHYSGLLRLKAVAEWLDFSVLDLVWGNGENLLRLIRFVVIVLGLMTFGDVAVDGDPGRVGSYVLSFSRSFEIFLGTLTPDDYWKGYLAFITCLRLVVVAFFLSIIMKKFNRRRKMHIYAFGSVCRGDISPGSDVDLLAVVEGHDARFSPDDYSIYSYERVREIWEEGGR